MNLFILQNTKILSQYNFKFSNKEYNYFTYLRVIPLLIYLKKIPK